MISDARGRHVSPGVYTEEKDVTYSVKSLGITSLGLVGETLYGPAFENIEITEWNDFVDYFGGTSSEKFRGTGLPKYELPYIAKSYLTKSKKLNVVRVLGLSGYYAGTIYCVMANNNMVLAVLRSKMKWNKGINNGCDNSYTYSEVVRNIKVEDYKGYGLNSSCNGTGQATTITGETKCQLVVTTSDGEERYNVSFDERDADYILKVIGSDPQKGDASIYAESVFEGVLGPNITIKKGDCKHSDNKDFSDYTSQFRYAQTPWILSQAVANTITSPNGGLNSENGNGGTTTCPKCSMKRLFRVITISDGNAANFQIKVSFEKIDPVYGTFDVVVRDFNDTDEYPVVLEKFSKCTMNRGETSFVGYKIGTSDGTFVNKSKYITIELPDNDNDYSGNVPCGFMGYPIPDYSKVDSSLVNPTLDYVNLYNPDIKAKKQYFGINSIDRDFLTFKGLKWTEESDSRTNGFHLDSAVGGCETEIDGKIYTAKEMPFTSVSKEHVANEIYIPRIVKDESYMNGTIYKDINLRKFTVCFWGGFDGWNIHAASRTTTDNYNGNRWQKLPNNTSLVNPYGVLDKSDIQYFNLPNIANKSDYYAYLAGYMVFANPQDTEINVFATPGIDWHNNTLLTEDAITMIEDPEDGRGGDALYIMASPYIDDSGDLISVEDAASYFEDTEINSSYACTYFPWVLYNDTARHEYIYLPPTKDVVRNIADTDNTSFPWFAPAGLTRGNVVCEKAAIKTTLSQEDTLYSNRINPIKTFGKDGVIVWGNKTAYDAESPLNRINVRRLMIRVKKLITSAAKQLIFEQYDDTLEKQFRGLVEPILASVKSNRGIFDYRVITQVTPETRDEHILPCKIMIKPTPALEYISISFVVYPESVQFEE